MAPLTRARPGGGLGSAACLRLLVGLLVLNLFCEACKKVTFNVPSELEARTLIGRVNLKQCLRNFDLISSSDPDFIVLQDGSVFTTHAISLSTEKKTFTILLKNLQDFQLKKIHINLLPHLKQTHRTGETVLRRTKRRWAPIPTILIENHLGPYPLQINKFVSDTAQRYNITYTISGPGVDQPPLNYFYIVKETGALMVTRVIDREKYPEFKIICNVRALDGSTPERPLVHVIRIEDDNDNPPIFNPDTVTFIIPESSRAGTIIGEMTATDRDEAGTLHTDVKYKIVRQEPITFQGVYTFNINRDTGCITLATPTLDREIIDRYVILIEARDMAGQSNGLCNTGTAIIQVEDSNDHAPMCEHAMYEAYVSENTVGAKVVDISAIDKDAHGTPAWHVTFNITKGNADGAFRIEKDQNSNIGTIFIEKGLDYEKTKERRLEIVVNNEAPYAVAPNARAISTSTCVVIVKVRDVDEGPVFDPCVYILNIKENLPGGTLVGDYRARDPETGNSEGIRYRILNDPCKWITINDAGEIRTTQLLDRDLPDMRAYQCNVTVSATDRSGKTGTGVVVVNLLDENDNFPVIIQPNYIMCNDRKPICLTAVDADISPHTVPFQFQLPNKMIPQWRLTPHDEKSAYLEPVGHIDYGVYTIPVQVTDVAGKSGITEVTVRVCDCTIPSDCRYQDRQKPIGTRNVTLGIWAILAMVLGSLLLLLILITLCGCCGGGCCGGAPVGTFKHVCDDSANQKLIISNTEAPGEECLMDPNRIHVKTRNMVTCDQGAVKKGGQECCEMVKGHQTPESVKGGGHHTLEIVKGMGHHTLDCGRGNGQSMVDICRCNYSEWQNFIHCHLTEKIYLCGQDEEHKHSDDYILSYNYEGRGSPAGSVGCCIDQQEEEALDFLDQLEPKFWTLAETCVKR